MTSIILVEFGGSLLAIRREILEFLGHPIVGVQGASAAMELTLARASPGVIIIGHRASREKRQRLINHFRQMVPSVPIVALIGREDSTFDDADYNCPAEQPGTWVRTVQTALAGIS